MGKVSAFKVAILLLFFLSVRAVVIYFVDLGVHGDGHEPIDYRLIKELILNLLEVARFERQYVLCFRCVVLKE